jgi:hypothetical protein
VTPHPTPTQQAVRRRIIGIAAVAVIGAGCAGTPLAPTHIVTGTFELAGSHQGGYGTVPCEGTGGYTDIREGAPVTLKDAAGTMIATSRLEHGSSSAPCDFTFAFPNVVEMPFYTVEVSHRGGLTYSLAEMKATGWTFALTLGK